MSPEHLPNPMSTDPRIEAAAIALYVAVRPSDRTPDGWGDVRPVWHANYRDSARAALAAADKAATITTVEELDALPIRSIIFHDEGWGMTAAKKSTDDGHWYVTGSNEYRTAATLLPAIVKHRGTE